MDHHDFKTAQERRMADLFAQSLPSDQKLLWAATRHVGRFFVYQHHTLDVVMRVTDQECRVMDRWHLNDVSVTFDHGLELELENSAGELCRVSHYPRKLGEHDVFVWIPPYLSDTRYLQTHKGYQLSLNICFRSRHAPGMTVEGNVYLEKTKA